MDARPGYSAAGSSMTALWLEVFRLNGLLLAHGDRLVADLGLTSARWQVLGAAVLAAEELTVSAISRRMGLSRQAVQRTVNELVASGHVTMVDNPRDKRARLVRLTRIGHDAYEAAIARQVPWANAVADDVKAADLAMIVGHLRTVGDRIESGLGMPEEIR